jgi:hypothetical protein
LATSNNKKNQSLEEDDEKTTRLIDYPACKIFVVIKINY